MSWTFQGIASQTKRDYYAAIVREWLSVAGVNSRQFVRETFAETSDDKLADEVIEGWSLDGQQPPSNATASGKPSPTIDTPSRPRPSRTTRSQTEPCGDRATPPRSKSIRPPNAGRA
jgi:hypothetical protein